MLEEKLLDYGLLGVMVVSLGLVVRNLYSARAKDHQKNAARIEILEGQMKDYLAQDRTTMLLTIQSCTKAIDANTAVLEQLVNTPAFKQDKGK